MEGGQPMDAASARDRFRFLPNLYRAWALSVNLSSAGEKLISSEPMLIYPDGKPARTSSKYVRIVPWHYPTVNLPELSREIELIEHSMNLGMFRNRQLDMFDLSSQILLDNPVFITDEHAQSETIGEATHEVIPYRIFLAFKHLKTSDVRRPVL
jgi:hypothetical protein